MYYLATLVVPDRGNLSYPLGDISTIKNPVYNSDNTQVYFKSDTPLPGNDLLQEITEEQYTSFKTFRESEILIGRNLEPPIKAPTEVDLLGQQLVEKELQILELQQENRMLGQQLVDIDLRLLMGGL